MRKFLLISGILMVVAGIVCLLASGLFYYTYHHAMDGSAEFYRRLHSRAVTFLITGTATEICGIIAIVLKYRLH